MATSWSGRHNLPHGYLLVGVVLLSQDVAGNSSTFQVSSAIYADAGWGPSNASGVSCAISGSGGLSVASSFNLNVGVGASQAIQSRTVTVSHASDGTLTGAAYAASIGDTGTIVFGSGGTATVTLTGVPSIARASQPTVSDSSVEAGDTVTIQTHRSSTSYTHDLTYKFGTKTGTITTGLGTDFDWTIPLSILTGIPSATSATCVITCVTKSGSTVIGSRTVNMTIAAGSGVVPTLSSITCTENVSGVASAVGGFVQKQSKLAVAIVGAVGVQGSTITGYRIVVDGQTINAVSGITGIVQSAGTLTITATVTDSRGRAGTGSGTITVLPWTPPQIDTGATGIVRADSDGTVDVENGTFFLTTLKASVHTLEPVSTEKNTLTYQVSTRDHTTGGTYTSKSTDTPSGISFDDTLDAFGTFDVSDSWDVLIEITDLFATTQYLIVVPTGAAILDIRPGGVGVLKRWEQGALDVKGDAYVSDTLRLPSTSDLSLTSTAHPLQIGPDTGVNLRLDNNEIETVNNGAASALTINGDGGGITLGSSASTLKLWGVTFEAAEGTVSGINVAAAGETSTTVTFPTGRFSAAPRVVATLIGDARNITSNVDAASTTSVVIRLGDAASTARTGLGFNWIGMRIR